MKNLLLAAALVFATPIYAGGPVIVEEAEIAPTAVRKPNTVLLVALVGLAVAAIVLGSGSDNCTSETTTPTPEAGC